MRFALHGGKVVRTSRLVREFARIWRAPSQAGSWNEGNPCPVWQRQEPTLSSLRKLSTDSPLLSETCLPHRHFLSDRVDGTCSAARFGPEEGAYPRPLSPSSQETSGKRMLTSAELWMSYATPRSLRFPRGWRCSFLALGIMGSDRGGPRSRLAREPACQCFQGRNALDRLAESNRLSISSR
jgi:hypothetical protein